MAEKPDASKETEPKAEAAPTPKGVSFGVLLGTLMAFLLLMLGAGFALAYFIVPKQLVASLPGAAVNHPAASGSTTNVTAVAHATGKTEGHSPEGAKGGHEASSSKKVEEFQLSELLVNVAGTRGARYCKVSLAFDAPQEVLGELEAQRARIVDIVSEVVSAKSMEEITSPSARGTLRTQLLASVNAFLKKGQVQNIYFLDFVIQ